MDRQVRVGIDQEVDLGQSENQALTHQLAGELRLTTGPPAESAGQTDLTDVYLLPLEEPLEIGRQLRRRLIALAGLFLQALEADVLERPGDGGPKLARRSRIVVENLGQRLGHGLAAEWGSPRKKLVEDRAQAVNVGRGRGLLAGDLLGSHVSGRAHEDA